MNRRDLLTYLAALGAGPLLVRFAEAVAAGEPMQAPVAESALSEPQRRMVAQLAELIIPTTDTPGAIAAGVPAFIDRIVTAWYTPTERGIFLQGLSDLDELCSKRHGKSFGDCTTQQQSAVLRDADEKARAYQARGGRIFDVPDEHAPFFLKLKQLAVIGYYTSQVGATQELAYHPVPNRYQGDIDFAAAGGRQWSF